MILLLWKWLCILSLIFLTSALKCSNYNIKYLIFLVLSLQLKRIKQFLVWYGIFARGELYITCLVCWESLLFHGVCIYILNLPPKAQRMCWDVPAALSSYPAQGSPAATELQRFCVLSCSCFVCVWISWDVVMDLENQNGIWELQLLL